MNIKIVLASARTWAWHRELINLLSREHSVSVCVVDNNNAYPYLLRSWLQLEHWLIRGAQITLPTSELANEIAASKKFANGNFIVVNLTEQNIDVDCEQILSPCFDGMMDSLYLVGALIRRENPYIEVRNRSRPRPLVGSLAAVEQAAVLSNAMAGIARRVLALIERAIVHIEHGTSAILPEVHVDDNKAQPYRNIDLFSFAWTTGLRKCWNKIANTVVRSDHWRVAYRRKPAIFELSKFDLSDFTIVDDDRKRYYADPFVFDMDGSYLFVEEYVYDRRKGLISCAKFNEDGSLQPFRPVLELECHVSYPFVFIHDGSVYLLPETSTNRQVSLYKAVSFPYRWKLHRVLLTDVSVHDATLIQWHGKWWMFATCMSHGSSSWDELSIFYSSSLDGPWQAHRLNPVKSDCRSARPAGRVVVCNGRLLRPAQDCSRAYGSGLSWCEIVELSPNRFVERVIAKWPTARGEDISGLHTFNEGDSLQVIDIQQTIPKYHAPWSLRGRSSVSRRSKKIMR